MQPVNGRLLVKVAVSEYKHVSITADKQYQTAPNIGTVLDVAKDYEIIVRRAFKMGDNSWPEGVPRRDDLIGKTVRWEKYADQNSIFDMDDPKNLKQTFKAALINWKDITAYAA